MFASNVIFVVLTIFGLAQAQVSFEGACPSDVKVLADFNVEQYLGLWYEYAKYPAFFETSGKCVTAEYTLQDDGNVGVVNSMINADTGKSDDIMGYAEPIANAKLKVIFPVAQTVEISTNYWVLDTDYKTYSVVYSCQPIDDNSHSTIIWILTREQLPCESIIEKTKQVIVENGLSLEPLVQTVQEGCKAE